MTPDPATVSVLPILHDAAGNEYIPRHPAPGLISISLCVIELFELYAMFDTRSAHAVAQGNPEFWAESEARAAELLSLAVALVPELGVVQRQRRQHPGGASREGTA